jgi:hypothetical protein
MTPEKKAEELIEKYANALPSVFYNSEEAKNYPRAKICALIAVDEIIITLAEDINPLVNYWFKVKLEIEKL